jgi:hypothetical protein
MPANTVLEAALRAADAGWPTFRLGYKQKIPLQGSRGFLDATIDKDILTDWFKNRNLNIGLATGGKERIVVLDIDNGHGGSESLHTLVRSFGELPEAPIVQTGNGFHVYLKMPGGTDIPPSAGKVGVGLDIRGVGGYVVYPPSVHPNESVYEWTSGEGQELPLAPQWLVELATDHNNQPAYTAVSEGVVIPMGQRNQAAASVAGYFRRFGLSSDQILSQLRALPFENPLTDTELRAISESISRYPKEHDFSGSQYKVDITKLEQEM